MKIENIAVPQKLETIWKSFSTLTRPGTIELGTDTFNTGIQAPRRRTSSNNYSLVENSKPKILIH